MRSFTCCFVASSSADSFCEVHRLTQVAFEMLAWLVKSLTAAPPDPDPKSTCRNARCILQQTCRQVKHVIRHVFSRLSIGTLFVEIDTIPLAKMNIGSSISHDLGIEFSLFGRIVLFLDSLQDVGLFDPT